MRALSCPVHMESGKARGHILRLLGYPPLSPQCCHHFLLPSNFLLLNLPHSFSSFILWNTSVNFPRNPLGSNLRNKSTAPVMGTLSLLNKEEDVSHTGGHCLDTLRPRSSFLVVLCPAKDLSRGSARGLGYHSFLSFPEPAVFPPSFLLLDAHVSGIHTHGSTGGGKHQGPHIWSLGAKSRVTGHSIMQSVHFSREPCWLTPNLCSVHQAACPGLGLCLPGGGHFFLCAEVTSIPQTLT